jgi:hypothetical protein
MKDTSAHDVQDDGEVPSDAMRRLGRGNAIREG